MMRHPVCPERQSRTVSWHRLPSRFTYARPLLIIRPNLRRSLISLLAVVILGCTACVPDSIGVVPSGGQSTAGPSLTPSAPRSESPVPDADEPGGDQEIPQDPAVPVVSEVPEPEPTTTPLMSQGDDGDRVRDLQHRLLQIQWFEGKITGHFGDETRLAVEGFQAKRDLPSTGEVDQATWDRLVAMTRQPTNDEMHNVLVAGPALLEAGSTGAEVKNLQARLKQLDWYSPKIDGKYGDKTVEAVRGFQAKREIPVTGEVDQRTLDRLVAMTRKPTTDELNNVVPTAGSSTMTLDDRCLQGRVICISKSQRKLALVEDGTIRLTMSVRFGSELTPTRNGVFSVYWKSRNHVSKLYGSKMPYALFFSGGQAVHYSSDFAARGYNGSSHGCVNVRDKEKVATLFDAVSEGDKVVVYRG
ncbi:Peptidoglycan-binding (PGRP) domain of peptidoglycan hydrolases-containing protein [Tessaracoccus bendigoensis DSM 12906]|uniref:Peptidoglycan-binding (PGRP) domain of peptidoglycan hydrolases-containing protein n=1 Tax=Tessaracoccus bendigoensis DSM 12906 TaxID=1123357 RepID=A0A1M6D3D1_9ACTN|nr:L,D-transpeptidase family protein [Tessaracoccus bendigoensis]SHI67805.1 Peptidoglycan-binding (PGRP) domain of peptidoglycan hydrolases-containing protein [Tessaracoccus bendigoensis DSM 12906]